MSSTSTATSNRTLQILAAARDGRYGVAALTCYDAHPAIIQLFPVTLKYGGGPFLRFCLDAARAASVPISVHLDHATTDEDVDFALTLAEQGIAFDSIMVDASHADTDEENIALTKVHVARATAAGVVVEAELGRLEGGEAGLRVVTDAQLTNPEGALTFLESTGTKILSPSVGNLHGIYLKPPGTLRDMCEPRGYFLCLHGTDGLSDELFKECVKNGCTKINLNSWMRDPSIETACRFRMRYDRASDVYAAVAERLMTVLGSAGKA
ncbi:aldolase [Zopfochytrium polystomum]|nr:aldolase [Zopfochytrium polystomum]